MFQFVHLKREVETLRAANDQLAREVQACNIRGRIGSRLHAFRVALSHMPVVVSACLTPFGQYCSSPHRPICLSVCFRVVRPQQPQYSWQYCMQL